MKSRHANRLVPTILAVATAGLSFPAWALDTIAPIPEPGTMVLLLGAVGAAVLVWRNRKK
jgi:PEP-CTERM motif